MRYRFRPTRPVADRFWEKVDKSGDCWLWTGHRQHNGYGRFYVGGRDCAAHRVSWELANGHPPPTDMQVMHTCDTPPCVRPDHLMLGTPKDNLQDAARKGRTALQRHPDLTRGENNGMHKLTAEAVREARAAFSKGESIAALARRFGVDRGGMWSVVHRRTWTHVTDEA